MSLLHHDRLASRRPLLFALSLALRAILLVGQSVEDLQTQLDQGRKELEQHDFRGAAAHLEQVRAKALEQKEFVISIKAGVNASSALIGLGEFMRAAEVGESSARLALQHDKAELAATGYANLAGAFFAANQQQLAELAVEHSLEILRGLKAPSQYEGAVLLQSAAIQAAQENWEKAEQFAREGQQWAARLGKSEQEATAHYTLASVYRHARRWREAASSIARAIEMSTQYGRTAPAAFFYERSEIALAQQEPAQAQANLARTLDIVRQRPSQIPMWRFEYLRARIFRQQKQPNAAFKAALASLHGALRWRLAAGKGTQARLSTEVKLQDLAQLLTALAAESNEGKSRPALIASALAAVEQCRAMVLREDSLQRQRLTPAYWAALARARVFEIARVTGKRPNLRAEREAQLQLTLLEEQTASRRAPSLALSPRSVQATQRSLSPHTAILVFTVGPEWSYLWTITHEKVFLRPIGRTPEIQSLASDFTRTVQSGEPVSRQVSASLYQKLFAGVPQEAHTRKRWRLVVDASLQMLPFPALISSSPPGASVRYLVQDHELELAPTMLKVRSRLPQTRPWGLFVGDPIYNVVDERANNSQRRPAALGLARLPASGREIAKCSRLWQGKSTVLAGASVSRQNLLRELDRRPTWVHIATHTLSDSVKQEASVMALGLGNSAGQEFLSIKDLQRKWSLQAVVLSACSSGAGKSVPGEGVIGFSSAWLSVGAEAVIATHWPVPDESVFMENFYRSLQVVKPDLTRALHTAQLQALKNNSPRIWANWFILVHP